MEDGLLQVNPETVLENLGMPKDTTIMMGSVWTELYQNKELNNQLYEVVKGRLPKKYNEVVVMVDENEKVNKNNFAQKIQKNSIL